ncbi:MAG TPA: polyketide cyclase / dehydrase and lipid transport [Actinomycetales bacterium]|nr:polyketide cyclase / dehydrase and lipid transport [Actinomycetales bacterium]
MGVQLRTVDLVDDTFVACDPAVVARLVAEPGRWQRWWPGLRLTTTRDRGLKGRQWAVQGALVGTAEIWLEPWWDGVLVHFYLRGESREHDRARQAWAQEWKRHVHALKDELESGRAPGGLSVADPGRSPDE